MFHPPLIVRTLSRAPDQALAVLAALSFALLDLYFLLAGQSGLNPCWTSQPRVGLKRAFEDPRLGPHFQQNIGLSLAFAELRDRMTFQAIVFAPYMRSGARLCIADLDQTVTRAPSRITIGSDVDFRFGACCPTLAEGRVTDFDPSSETAFLTVDGTDWPIKRCPHRTGVSAPPMISENWFVD